MTAKSKVRSASGVVDEFSPANQMAVFNYVPTVVTVSQSTVPTGLLGSVANSETQSPEAPAAKSAILLAVSPWLWLLLPPSW